jgi:stage III sporulation protein AE
MPEDTQNFASGFWKLLLRAVGTVRPDIREAFRVCAGLLASVLLISVVGSWSETIKKTARLIGTAAIGSTLLLSMNSMVTLGSETVAQMCEYGKLLIPVMAAALAAQGGSATSAALYSGTAAVIALISALVSRILLPMVYLFLGLAAANRMTGEDLLKRMKELVKWCVSWCLKTVLTLFTTYMGLTGVISGTADAAAVKAAKAAISTAVPVVGGILSEASELVLVSAGTLGSAAGVYGMLTVLALFSGPFLGIGIQYALLKGVSAFCSGFSPGGGAGLLEDFSTAMGLILAMVSTQTVMLLVSTLCFMKGVG